MLKVLVDWLVWLYVYFRLLVSRRSFVRLCIVSQIVSTFLLLLFLLLFLGFVGETNWKLSWKSWCLSNGVDLVIMCVICYLSGPVRLVLTGVEGERHFTIN